MTAANPVAAESRGRMIDRAGDRGRTRRGQRQQAADKTPVRVLARVDPGGRRRRGGSETGPAAKIAPSRIRRVRVEQGAPRGRTRRRLPQLPTARLEPARLSPTRLESTGLRRAGLRRAAEASRRGRGGTDRLEVRLWRVEVRTLPSHPAAGLRRRRRISVRLGGGRCSRQDPRADRNEQPDHGVRE